MAIVLFHLIFAVDNQLQRLAPGGESFGAKCGVGISREQISRSQGADFFGKAVMVDVGELMAEAAEIADRCFGLILIQAPDACQHAADVFEVVVEGGAFVRVGDFQFKIAMEEGEVQFVAHVAKVVAGILGHQQPTVQASDFHVAQFADDASTIQHVFQGFGKAFPG